MDPGFHGTRSFGTHIRLFEIDLTHVVWRYPFGFSLTNFFSTQMMPGLAFLYAGLLHKRSAVTMIMQNFASVGVIFILVS